MVISMKTVLKRFQLKMFILIGYLSSNIKHVALDAKAEKKSGIEDFKKFKSDGILNLGKLPISSELINELIENKIAENSREDVIYDDSGRIRSIYFDLNSPFLSEYVYTKRLFDILTAYYGHKSYYLRNRPSISFSYADVSHGAQEYHVDWGLRQVTLMANLTNVKTQDTHMEYISKSNNKYWFYPPDRLSKRFINYADKVLHSSRYGRFNTYGEIGTTFLFDAGNGLHRQVSGENRIILHINFVDNLAFTGFNPDWKFPEVMRRHWLADEELTIIERGDGVCPDGLFDLMKQSLPKNFLTPKIYNLNYNK
jgi:hypothetical protein